MFSDDSIWKTILPNLIYQISFQIWFISNSTINTHKHICRRKWQRTPVFLPEKFHGQRSLAVYSPWGHQESDTTEWLSTYNMELKRSGIHYLNKNMLRKIEESNHSNVGCTCARWEKNICIWAEKFNMMEGPGKHSHPSSSVVCVAWKKYCLRPSKVFIDGKLSNVFQEGWNVRECE